MQEELYKIAREVVHGIASPISTLRAVEYISEGKLSEQSKNMLDLAIKSMEKMSDELISKYKRSNNSEKGKESKEEEYIKPYESLLEIVKQYKYSNRNSGIEIKYKEDRENKVVSIKGEKEEFKRMMMNLIRNAEEAIEKKQEGVIAVRCIVKGNNVEISIKDNGNEMPKEMAEKLMKGEEVGTTKKEGHGIGMAQAIVVVKDMKGKIDIKTEDKVGTEIILTFPLSEKLNNEKD